MSEIQSAANPFARLDARSQAQIRGACEQLDAEMVKIRRSFMSIGAVCLAVGAVAYAVMWNHGLRDPRVLMGMIALAFGLYVSYRWRSVTRDYKRLLVTAVVDAMGNGMTYSPVSRFTRQDFLDMDLFQKRVERWTAEDEVTGRKNAVAYSILEGKATRTEGSGKSRHTVTIFRGSIVRLDFNKYFSGHTVVVPDHESKILGGLFGEASSRHRKELCRLENPTFESRFSVYSTDQQQARYILTPKMMELILRVSATHHDLRMSFQNNSVIVTIPSTKNRFEIRGGVFRGRISPDAVYAELAEVVGLAEELIDTLDLETRIWSRA